MDKMMDKKMKKKVFKEINIIIKKMDKSGNDIVFENYVIPNLKKLKNGGSLFSKMFDEVQDRYGLNFFEIMKDGEYFELYVGKKLNDFKSTSLWYVFDTLLDINGLKLQAGVFLDTEIESKSTVNSDGSITMYDMVEIGDFREDGVFRVVGV